MAGNDKKYMESLELAMQRVRAIFANRNVTIKTDSESEEERVRRIAQEVIDGKRDFDAVRVSVDRIAKGGTNATPDKDPPTSTHPDPDDPYEPSDPEPQEPAYDEPDPVDYKAQAAGMFPWLPPELLNEFADAWADTGSSYGALAHIRNSSSYEKYFPGNKLPDGRIRLDEGDYLRYSDSVKKMFRVAGLPTGFYDEQTDIADYLDSELSIEEIKSRIDDGFIAARNAIPEVRMELAAFYGVNEGELAAFFLDPDKAEELLIRRLATAQIGAASRVTGYGRLSAGEAERLQAFGLDFAQAQQGFAELAQNRSLFSSLLGSSETSIGRDEQIAGQFDMDANARDAMTRRQRSRLSAFGGGGGAAVSGEGLTGLTSSNT